MTAAREQPALSIILACTDEYETIRHTITHLRRQTECHRLELVIVAADIERLQPDRDALADFWGYRIVAAPGMSSIARANAAGVRAARAELVALAEDHCFPQPGWAAALIERHRGPWAAVGPVISNANPTSAVSWCDYLIGYGLWAGVREPGEAALLPGHNSSYKRSVLLAYGDGLADMLEAETVLHADLRRRGERLFLEPRARSAHLNIALLASWLPLQFYNGRMFGGSRARRWPWPKRVVYAGGSPLIPALRLWRILRGAWPPAQPHPRLVGLLPLLLTGLALDAFGQLAGYLAGIGSARGKLPRFEFRRVDHITAEDRQALDSAPAPTRSDPER